MNCSVSVLRRGSIRERYYWPAATEWPAEPDYSAPTNGLVRTCSGKCLSSQAWSLKLPTQRQRTAARSLPRDVKLSAIPLSHHRPTANDKKDCRISVCDGNCLTDHRATVTLRRSRKLNHHDTKLLMVALLPQLLAHPQVCHLKSMS